MIGSYDPAVPPPPVVSPPLSTLRIWWLALTQPSVTTYRQILSQAEGKTWHGYGWVLFAALGSGFIAWCVGTVALTREYVFEFDIGTACTGPLLVILIIPGLIFTAGLAQGVAKALGGAGHYPQLMYLIAASQAPLLLISGLVGQLPWVGPVLNVGLLFYGYFLIVVAVEATHHVGWGQALVASLVGNTITTGVLACVTLTLLALFAPAVERNYWNILMTQEPAQPQTFAGGGLKLTYSDHWRIQDLREDALCQQADFDCLLGLAHFDGSTLTLIQGPLLRDADIKELAEALWAEVETAYPTAHVEDYEILRLDNRLAFKRVFTANERALVHVGVIEAQQYYLFTISAESLLALHAHQTEIDALLASVEFTP